MALIALACYDTIENGRSHYTMRTLLSLKDTVDLERHRVVIVDNASCDATKRVLETAKSWATVITNEVNVGTAKAINQAWALRKPKEHLIKMDNDVEFYFTDWVDDMEYAIETDKSIGILGLKRKDLMENPFRNDHWKTTLRMLPHNKGDRWIIVEDAEHIMGTCTMFNYRLIEKIGGMYQMDGLYGFDDTLACVRCKLAGFKNSFLPHIEIDHIDEGGNEYTDWKRKYAGQMMDKFNEVKRKFATGEQSIYIPI